MWFLLREKLWNVKLTPHLIVPRPLRKSVLKESHHWNCSCSEQSTGDKGGDMSLRTPRQLVYEHGLWSHARKLSLKTLFLETSKWQTRDNGDKDNWTDQSNLANAAAPPAFPWATTSLLWLRRQAREVLPSQLSQRVSPLPHGGALRNPEAYSVLSSSPPGVSRCSSLLICPRSRHSHTSTDKKKASYPHASWLKVHNQKWKWHRSHL